MADAAAAEKKDKKEKAATDKAAAEDAANRKHAADAEAKRRRRGRSIDVRLSDARMAELDEVSKRLRKLLQLLAPQHWSPVPIVCMLACARNVRVCAVRQNLSRRCYRWRSSCAHDFPVFV